MTDTAQDVKALIEEAQGFAAARQGFDDGAAELVDRLTAALTALEARGLVVAADQWLPIESAPKDGTLVLCAAGLLMASCMFRSHLSPPWVLPRENGWLWPFGSSGPTHWRPLPAPPATEQAP